MTEKQVTSELGYELLKLISWLALQMPKGINYELWKELHQLIGDWE